MVIRKVIDSDLSGKPDAATVTFGVDDQWYEVDLTPEERKKLEASLQQYIKAGRRAPEEPKEPKESKKKRKRKAVLDLTPEQRLKIREWAQENDLEVSWFGAIRKEVISAYWDAHGGPPANDSNNS